MRSYSVRGFFNAKTRVLSFPSGRRHAKKFRLASLGFNVLRTSFKNEEALPPKPPTPCRRGYKVRYGAHLLRRRRCLLEPPTPFRRGPKGRCPSGLQRPARSVKSWGKDPHALTSLARRDTLSHYIFLSSYGIKKTMCSVYPF